MKRATWIALLLVVAGVLGLLTLVRSGPEDMEEVTVKTGYPPAARENPLLAAERFLQRMGLPAESRLVLGELPSARHVLVLTADRAAFGASRRRELVDWIASGGHVVVQAGADDVGYDENEDEDEPDWLLELAGIRGWTGEGELRRRRVQVPGNADPLWLEVDSQRELSVAGASPATIASVAYEHGRITALADSRFLANDAIGKHQHARALWHLVNAHGAPAGVWLVPTAAMPSFLTLLLRHGAPALAALGLLVLLWLWRAGQRLGPLLPAPASGHRDLAEHVRAAGHWLLRTGRAGVLLDAARENLQRRLLARRPHWAALDAAALAEELSTTSGLDRQRVHQALRLPVASRDAFTSAIRDIELLRKTL